MRIRLIRCFVLTLCALLTGTGAQADVWSESFGRFRFDIKGSVALRVVEAVSSYARVQYEIPKLK